MGIFPDDVLQRGHLDLVDHADQNMGLAPLVHPLCRDEGGAVAQPADDGVGDLPGMIGDDLAADGAAAAFHQTVGYRAGHEAVKDAQDHRLHPEVIDKIAADGHRHIEKERDPEKALLRVGPVDEGSHEIRAAAAGAAPHQQGIAGAVDDAGHQRSQNDAAGGLIGKSAQVQPPQRDEEQGKGHHIQHTAARQIGAHLFPHPQGERNVDDEAEIAHVDARQVLDHGADAVESCGSEPVGKDEQLIVQGADQGQPHDDKIGEDLFCGPHRRQLLLQFHEPAAPDHIHHSAKQTRAQVGTAGRGIDKIQAWCIISLVTEYGFKLPLIWCQVRRIIENRVRIPDGTAAVCAEAEAR